MSFDQLRMYLDAWGKTNKEEKKDLSSPFDLMKFNETVKQISTK